MLIPKHLQMAKEYRQVNLKQLRISTEAAASIVLIRRVFCSTLSFSDQKIRRKLYLFHDHTFSTARSSIS